jgi:hypothetical protein
MFLSLYRCPVSASENFISPSDLCENPTLYDCNTDLLAVFSFTGNKKSIAGGGASYFYGKPGLQFYTQLKTVTSLWKSEDAISKAADVAMPTHS